MIAERERPRTPEPEAPPVREEDPGVEPRAQELVELVGGHVREIVGHVSTLIEVRKERARLALRRHVFHIVLSIVLGLVVLVIAFEASRQLASGLAAGLGALTGAAWLGELASGLVLLALVFGGALALLSGLERREFQRRKAAHAARHGHEAP